jgi:predicted ATPase
VLRKDTDADLSGCGADDKGENDRSLIRRTAKPDRSTRHQVSDRVPANTPKSMVMTDTRSKEPRFRPLATTRAYGFAKLEQSGELDVLRTRYAEHYRDKREHPRLLMKSALS